MFSLDNFENILSAAAAGTHSALNTDYLDPRARVVRRARESVQRSWTSWRAKGLQKLGGAII